MATSRVPAAIQALVETLNGSAELAGVTIVDGPSAVDFSGRRRICVGWSPGADTATDIVQDFAYAGGRRRDEQFTIHCYAEARAGDKDMRLRREAVFGLLAIVEDILRQTDQQPTAGTLGGTVLWAYLATGSLIQEQNGNGTLAGLSFTVSCQARI
jgi:hypothetical protein